MNICFICDEYPPVSHGGIGTITKSLAEELVIQGHKVFVIGILPLSFGGEQHEIVNGVEIWRIHHGVKIPLLSRNSLLYKAINKILKTDFIGLNKVWIEQNRLVEKLVKAHNIEIIEFPDYRLAYTYLNLKSDIWPKIDIPKIVKFHGSTNYFNLEADKTISKPDMFYETDLYNYATQLVSVSLYTKLKMISYYNLTKSIEVLHNGLEIVDKPYIGLERFIVFSGSLLPKKGIIPLLKAWNTVCDSIEGITLKLYGKGIKERFTKYIEPKHAGRVQFLGHTNKEHLLEEYTKAKLAVFPSFSEAFALAPMEAMMVGCPTVYSNSTSGDELSKEKNELVLIDPYNVDAFSKTLIDLLTDDGLRMQIGQQGKLLIKNNFNINKIAKNHLNLFERLIDNGVE
ncbi:glycosyltransferase family 4 protein [Formosa sp. 4Alg 33]|uniref:glycosyltransferase family 4 protein n=1 Tax=Formosa sp. 4Alg 33 TaxID=3382189 RepID=UPI003D9C4760